MLSDKGLVHLQASGTTAFPVEIGDTDLYDVHVIGLGMVLGLHFLQMEDLLCQRLHHLPPLLGRQLSTEREALCAQTSL
jgi:hypothetical protein